MKSSSSKPILSFWQLWNMSFGFFGIQFGFALQNANTSRIFSTLGANPDDLALFWLAAPVTGLLVQPIIGYLSDNTWHPYWGRRRPFFFLGAILASIATARTGALEASGVAAADALTAGFSWVFLGAAVFAVLGAAAAGWARATAPRSD